MNRLPISKKSLVLFSLLISVVLGSSLGFYRGEPRNIVLIAVSLPVMLLSVLFPAASLPILMAVWSISNEYLGSIESFGGGHSITLPQLFGGVVTVVLAFAIILHSRMSTFFGDRLIVYYLLSALWTFAVSAVSGSSGIQFLFRYLSGCVLFLASYNFLSSPKGFDWYLLVGIISGLLSSLVTLMQLLLNTYYPNAAMALFSFGTVHTSLQEGIARSLGITGGSFITGVFLLIPLVFCLIQLQRSHHIRYRIVLAIVIVLHLLAILATVTRTAILATLLLVAMWLVLLARRSKTFILPGLLIIFLIVVMLFFAKSSLLVSSALERFTAKSMESGNGRLMIWEAIMTAFLKLPIANWLVGGGIGFGYSESTPALGIPQIPHNQYIWLLSDTGLFGLGFYLFWISASWHKIYVFIRDRQKNDALFLGGAGFLVLSVVYHLFVGLFWNFTGSVFVDWYLLSFCGVVLGLVQKHRISRCTSSYRTVYEK